MADSKPVEMVDPAVAAVEPVVFTVAVMDCNPAKMDSMLDWATTVADAHRSTTIPAVAAVELVAAGGKVVATTAEHP